jgi:putative selenium metabolism hydrolase
LEGAGATNGSLQVMQDARKKDAMSNESPVVQRAEQLRHELAQFASRLIQAKSTSCDEGRVVDVIRSEMLKVGFDEITIDGLGNIIGRIGSGRTKIAMDAHIDTVDVGSLDLWERTPFSGDIDETWVHGRGAADQKSGMASMVYGMKILKDLDLLGDFTIYIVGSVMEEDCDGLCWRYLIDEHGLVPDYAVITEPTSLRINRGQKGRIEFRIRTSGVAAHASAPERGKNAVYAMARIISEIECLNETLHVDSFLGKGTIVVSEITSVSPSVNAVPDQCEIHIDRRLTAGETRESALAEIAAILDRIGVSAEIIELDYDKPSYTGVRFPTEKYFPVWVLDEQHPIVDAAAETYRRVFNDKPTISHWDFSTNGTVITGVYGIPAIGFGPGDEKYAHAPNEKVAINDLIAAAAFYAAFPRVICEMVREDEGA